MILVGAFLLAGVGAGAEVWIGVTGETCFWTEGVPLVEIETGGWRQGVGLWDLLRDGPDETGTGDGEDVGVSAWAGVTNVIV